MSPDRKPRDSAEIPEEIKAEVLARVYEFILSWPIPSREPEESVTESPGDSAESEEDPRAEVVTEKPGDSAEGVTESGDPPRLTLAERIALTYATGERLIFRTKRGSVFHLLETWNNDPENTLIRSYCLSPGEAYIPYDSIRDWRTIPDIWPEEPNTLCRKCIRLFIARDPGSPEEENEKD